MIKTGRYIKRSVLLIAALFLMASCRDESPEIPGHGQTTDGEDQRPYVTLKIGTISSGKIGENNISEKIKTLRVIMVNEDDDANTYVEFNHLIDFTTGEGNTFNGTGELASSFQYILTKHTVAGAKKFYLVANEGSVGSVNFQMPFGTPLPSRLKQGMTLTAMLDSYTPDFLPGLDDPELSIPGDYGAPPKGKEFETVMNSVYFTPDYQVSGGEIYLPYTAYYDGYTVADMSGEDITDGSQKPGKIEATMYLVPTASKCEIKFINYRKNNVQVEKAELTALSSATFLNAQLDEKEQFKTLYDQPVWWINWLAQCNKLSQQYDDLADFNETWGWISEYTMPETDAPVSKTYSPDPNTFWIVDALVDKDNPDILTAGPYYIPESRYMVEREFFDSESQEYYTKELQLYSLKVWLHEEEEIEIFESEPMEINNLKSLFRATHLVINISMYESQVEIYCEVQPWIPILFNGYVQEEIED